MTGSTFRSVWAPRVLCLAAGAAAALAQPPWGFLPGLLGYGLLFRLCDAASPKPLKSAFFRAWLTGAAYFMISLWWLAEPFQVDAEEQGWMAPFAVLLMAGGMALFWGAAGVAYRALAGRGIARTLLFAGTLSGFEFLRGHILTGFPWDLPGESWAAGSPPSQLAAVVGVYGLTLVTVLVAALPFAMRIRTARGLAPGLAAGLIVAGLYGFGAWRLDRSQGGMPGTLWLRVVQADVGQESKYDARAFESIVARYVALTARPAAHRIDMVIWPEGAIPAAMEDYLAPGAWTERAIANALGPNQTLILGAYHYGQDVSGRPRTFNALAVLRHAPGGLQVVGLYDKFRLVPFGEFMPLDGLASHLGIKAMVHVGDGFSPGPRPRPLRVAGLPTMQPLICYEALFPGFTREGAAASGQRAAWIVNVSNDAWFGTGMGPMQHLNMARYRAIEEGLPIVRATPTGISAVIDAFGRIAPGQSLGEGALGVIDARLPPALAPTLFDRLGDMAFFAMLGLSLLGARFWSKPDRARPSGR